MKRLLAVLASSLVIAAANADDISDTYVVPVAGHVESATATWLTDLTIHNPGAAAVVVDLAGVASDGTALDLETSSIVIPPHGTSSLAGLVRTHGVGALIAAGSGPFALAATVRSEHDGMHSRTAIAPAPTFITRDGGPAFLPGLISDSAMRSNIGFFAAAGATPLRIEVVLLDGNGVTLGTRTFEVGAGSMTQIQASSRLFTSAPFAVATARVRVVDGDGAVAPYAALVDAASGSATFIAPLTDRASLASATARALFRNVIEVSR